jgi:hypothetical protein
LFAHQAAHQDDDFTGSANHQLFIDPRMIVGDGSSVQVTVISRLQSGKNLSNEQAELVDVLNMEFQNNLADVLSDVGSDYISDNESLPPRVTPWPTSVKDESSGAAR